MIFESIALNAAVLIILIVALTLDYLTKFFSYWYVRLIPYKVPVPAFGSDYERVLGVSDSAGVANRLYFKHPKDKYVGYIKSRIPELIVRDPDVIKLVLNDDFNHFSNRGLCLDRSSDSSLRNNLFFAENELWSSLRPRLQSFYESEASLNSTPERANLFQRKLPLQFSECNVRELAHELTSTLVYTYLFKEEKLTSTDRELFSKITDRLRNNSLAARMRNYTMSIFPSLYLLFGMSRIEKPLVQSLKSMISRTMQRVTDAGIFVRFLQKQKEEGPMDLTPEGKLRKPRRKIVEFDDDVVASQLISLMGDGILPCSNAVAATLYELAKEPDVLADVHRELDILRGDLREAKVLERVIDEALRLHPTYSLLHRVCVSTYKIPNTSIVIDKRVTVAIPVAAIHKDPAYYKDPEKFDPSRFSAEEVRKRHPYTYLPFGAGPRSCIGERVARRWVLECVAGVLHTHTVTSCGRTPRSLTLTHGAFASTLQRDVWLTISPRHLSTSTLTDSLIN